MRLLTRSAIAGILSASLLCWAQSQHQQTGTASVRNPGVTVEETQDADLGLSTDDRLSVVAAALDAKARLHFQRDCSHLVHAIYERAGFAYPYAPSLDLYRGVGAFRGVKVPELGDLVVWRGHVGIVIKPSERLFFSLMRSGPRIDDWETEYWKKRGQARFYRYIKTPCESCASIHYPASPVVRIKQKY
jgi:NlpC/P60 family